MLDEAIMDRTTASQNRKKQMKKFEKSRKGDSPNSSKGSKISDQGSQRDTDTGEKAAESIQANSSPLLN